MLQRSRRVSLLSENTSFQQNMAIFQKLEGIP